MNVLRLVVVTLPLATALQAQQPLGWLAAEKNLLTGYSAVAGEGMINAVIEIPAGTNAKWEVVKDGSGVEWEIEDGRPRVVNYLPYPANYGMVPGTLLPEDQGGDGDPLDVIVLGPANSRGTVMAVRPIGLLLLVDDGERDDKIIAVAPEGPLGSVFSLDDLTADYPGAARILEIWFTAYKGPGRLESDGFAGRDEAWRIIAQAAAAFEASRSSR